MLLQLASYVAIHARVCAGEIASFEEFIIKCRGGYCFVSQTTSHSDGNLLRHSKDDGNTFSAKM